MAPPKVFIPPLKLHLLQNVAKPVTEKKGFVMRQRNKFRANRYQDIHQVLSDHVLLGSIYEFLPYNVVLSHKRVRRIFNEALHRVPLSIVCTGTRANSFCRHVASTSDFPNVLHLRLMNTDEHTVGQLTTALSHRNFPRFKSFEYFVNLETGDYEPKRLIRSFRSPSCQDLCKLDLSGSYLGKVGIQELSLVMKKNALRQLTYIDISRNGATSAVGNVASALENGHCPRITYFNVAHNSCSSAFAALGRMLRSRAAPHLDLLDCSYNDINVSAVESFAHNFSHISRHHFIVPLCKLTLSYNSLGDGGLAALCRGMEAGVWSQLATLQLSCVDMGDNGVRALARVLQRGGLPLLEELDISYNAVSKLGARVLAPALLRAHQLSPSRLSSLNLAYTHLTDEGTFQLCSALDRGACPQLQRLNMEGNGARHQALQRIAALLQAGSLPVLTALNLTNTMAYIRIKLIFPLRFHPIIVFNGDTTSKITNQDGEVFGTSRKAGTDRNSHRSARTSGR